MRRASPLFIRRQFECMQLRSLLVVYRVPLHTLTVIMDDDDKSSIIPSPTKEKSKCIQAIDKEAVHRICSGQVVLNLATAVKELVENSLDAGATSVEIRLKEYGSELVEVIDNGCGVEESNFEGLTLKHHTSKLREFTDLLGVETFGFRGEALSSLCALSELTVTTRHVSSSMGTKLVYDARGFIISKTLCARQIGTTVTLGNLFSPLPVRQKEFHRNLKREFVKMSQLLHAYCLISKGVKILCTNQTKKGGKTTLVSTQGSPTVKGNIMCIFGAKQTNSLLDIEIEKPSATHLEEMGLSSEIGEIKGFELEGCISSCAHGQGRSSTDRQFYYINDRPCDPTKVSKVVNEVYHQFNVHQFPFVFLNIKTARDSVDINVTPDKRQIFLDNEKLLVATVKASLLKLYEKIPHTFQVQNVAIGSSKSEANNPADSGHSASSPTNMLSKISSFSSLLKNFSHSHSRSTKDPDNFAAPKEQAAVPGRGVKRTINSGNYDRDGKKQLCLSDFVSRKNVSTANDHDSAAALTIGCELEKKVIQIYNDDESSMDHTRLLEETDVTDLTEPSGGNMSQLKAVEENLSKELQESARSGDSLVSEKISCSESKCDSFSENPECSKSDLNSSDEEDSTHSGSHIIKCSSFEPTGIETKSNSPILLDTERTESKRKSVMISVNMDKIQEQFLRNRNRSKQGSIELSQECKPRIRFYAEIDPTKNKSAEQELNKEITKDMFKKMEIIGQFNLGFIITKLHHDLFIVDQHATDEKYNFETLQAHTTLKNQRLVIPQALDLTAVNECILMDNLDIFTKNGFQFVIDNTAEPTKRIRLAAKPISHNWEFGKEDIDELLFMLQDSPHTMCRPSRVRAMFASRACRKSVMIGTALSKSTMRQLVNHMGEIEQPWNCPHGRPTMRHLVNLELVRKKK